VVRRSYGPNKHVQPIHRAQDSVTFEQEGAKKGDGVLTCLYIYGFEVEVEVGSDA
jgi:hypothetical protein